MLLRSSSTPVLGSLISSISDSPNNNSTNLLHHNHHSLNKSPYHPQIGSLNSSPISPSIAEFSENSSRRGLRRAQSEGNLEGLAFASCNNSYEDSQNLSRTKKISGRRKCIMLETIPSFSLSNLKGRFEEEEENEIADGEGEGRIEVEAHAGLTNKMDKMVLSEQGVRGRNWNVGFEGERGFNSEEMYLARGLGIDGGNNNGIGGVGGGRGGHNGDFHWAGGGDGEPMRATEEYYKKMVHDNPGNPLFLRNYAQFLHQKKGDLEGAEEYYSRAILADPKDGEILSQYAKLVWELHRDQDKASSYFERAAQASPEDSQVHAAYASFLWETEEDEDECNVPHFHEGVMASAGV